MFENLSERLERSFKILKGEGKITEINVAETLKDVRRALLDADVNYKVAKQFTDTVKTKALGQDVLTAVKPGQLMVKIVHDELATLMGGETAEVNLSQNPSIILMSGLQGSGKTTFSGKLAKMLKSKKGKRPLLVACDVYRPAAIEQLKVLGEQIDVPVFRMDEKVDPVRIARYAVDAAKSYGKDVLILDTAGRLHIDEALMQELKNIKSEVKPHEILLVLDSMTGQDAVTTAQAFDEALGIDGTVLTKMDGDARGGAALSIKTVTGKPIKLIGVSEKLADGLEEFHPDRMAGRILDLGDLATLFEKAQREFDEDEAKRMQEQLAAGEFSFDDFLQQLQQLRKLGSLQSIMGMLPGMGKIKDQLKNVDLDGSEIKRVEAMIRAMTPQERRDPGILNGSRRKRIAMGSGTKVQDVNRLTKQFMEMRKMMKRMKRLEKNKKGGLRLPFLPK